MLTPAEVGILLETCFDLEQWRARFDADSHRVESGCLERANSLVTAEQQPRELMLEFECWLWGRICKWVERGGVRGKGDGSGGKSGDKKPPDQPSYELRLRSCSEMDDLADRGA